MPFRGQSSPVVPTPEELAVLPEGPMPQLWPCGLA